MQSLQDKQKIIMQRHQIRLYNICKEKGFKTFDEVRGYAYNYKKYDNLTLRMIDEVVSALAEQKPRIEHIPLAPIDPSKPFNGVTLY
jgi:hypothetical protein